MEGYRSGESTTTLAEAFGCSQNTVIRTVKTLLPLEEYNALKASRSKKESSHDSKIVDRPDSNDKELSFSQEIKTQTNKGIDSNSNRVDEDLSQLELEDEFDPADNDSTQHLALNDAEDFRDDSILESINQETFNPFGDDQLTSLDVFQEIAPLASEFDIAEPHEVKCLKLEPGVLPDVVYMLVDRSVELDARPLKEFSDLAFLSEVEKERYGLCLFSNQRSAKRSCARSQRVIKIPNSSIFGISKSFLLARGITRLVLEGVLIALDEEVTV